MRQIAIIRNSDIIPNAPFIDPTHYPEREAARAIVFDGAKVALLYVAMDKSYKLPGGGIETGETKLQALHREILEEIGCHIEDVKELGETLEYMDHEPERQRSYCFTAHAVGKPLPVQLTENEQAMGLKAIWANSLAHAITMLEKAQPTDISARFIRHRELLFLKAAASQTD